MNALQVRVFAASAEERQRIIVDMSLAGDDCIAFIKEPEII